MSLCDGYYKLVVVNQYGKKQTHQYELFEIKKLLEKLPYFMDKNNSNMCVIYKIKKNQSVNLDITKLL